MKNNILIINDGSESISYTKQAINADYTYCPSLDELYEIFKDNPFSIFSCNTKNCITFILEDGNEISLYQYLPDMHKPVFLKIINDILINENIDILIAVNNDNYIYKSPDKSRIQWGKQVNRTQLKADSLIINTNDAFKHINGYEISQKIIHRRQQKIENIPAFKYCNDQIITLNNNATYQGYLPSIYQLHVIIIYHDILNFIMHQLGKSDIKAIYAWSSSEYDKRQAWFISENGKAYKYSKDGNAEAIPLFHLNQ